MYKIYHLAISIFICILCFSGFNIYGQTAVYERTIYSNNYYLKVFKNEFDSSVYFYKHWRYAQSFSGIDLHKINSTGTVTGSVALEAGPGFVNKIIPMSNGFLACRRNTLLNRHGLIKFDLSGNVIWSNEFDISGGFQFLDAHVDESNNSILMSGTPAVIAPPLHEKVLMECDTNGVVNFINKYTWTSGTGLNGFIPHSLIRKNNGNYILISGRIGACVSCITPYLLELDSAFNILLGNSVVMANGVPDNFKFIKKPDDGFYMIGSIMSNTPEYYLYGFVINFSPAFTPLWSLSTDNVNFNYGLEFNDATLTPDGGLIIGGNYTNQLGWSDMMLMKMDSLGTLQWSTRYGKESDDEELSSLIYSQNDGIYFAGGGNDTTFSHSDINGLLLKTDTAGVTTCEHNNFTTGLNSFNVLLQPISFSKSSQTFSSVPVAVTAAPPLTLLPTCDGVVSGSQELLHSGNIEIYPNPASDNIFIRGRNFKKGDWIGIYDARGIVVFEKYISDTIDVISIPASSLSKGFYFVKGITGSGIFSGKMIIHR